MWDKDISKRFLNRQGSQATKSYQVWVDGELLVDLLPVLANVAGFDSDCVPLVLEQRSHNGHFPIKVDDFVGLK